MKLRVGVLLSAQISLLFPTASSFCFSRWTTRIGGTSRLFAQKALQAEKFWSANTEKSCWRPTVNDVERISFGKPAKKKRTGSRGVPHRLNQDERLLFDQARRKGFLEVTGSGWRSQRRDAPLLNTYRSLCDARAQVCIVLHKATSGQQQDVLVCDLSTLRIPNKDSTVVAEQCIATVQTNGLVGALMEPEVPVLTLDDNELEDLMYDSDDQDRTTRPIYQLPPFLIKWQGSRSDLKVLGKELATVFETSEGKKAASKKPVGVKPGKSRRHGGYGIG